MRAILLAAGLGTRLRPITDTTPKCLVPINGKPLLDYWLDSLAEAEISSILINLHHHPEQIRQFIQKRTNREQIILVSEVELLGTGGTVKENSDFCLGEPILIAHADNYCLSNLADFIAAHRNRPPNTEISMLTFVTNNPKNCGIVELNSEGVVVGFHEKVSSPPGDIANGAVYIFEPTVVQSICSMTPGFLDLSKDVLPEYLGRINTWPATGIHIDIGTPAELSRARESGRSPQGLSA